MKSVERPYVSHAQSAKDSARESREGSLDLAAGICTLQLLCNFGRDEIPAADEIFFKLITIHISVIKF